VRVVVQRVTQASVTVDGAVVGQIGPGLLVLVGFRPGDGEAELDWMATKLVGLRLFEDAAGKMNLAVPEIGGELLLVPQFTLYGDCRKGRRPGFSEALAPEQATVLFDCFCDRVAQAGRPVARGVFGAHMQVALLNDGPVTLIIDRDSGSGNRDSGDDGPDAGTRLH
jgi:D-tyrosyl-tRNA(Tyr) deacylase